MQKANQPPHPKHDEIAAQDAGPLARGAGNRGDHRDLLVPQFDLYADPAELTLQVVLHPFILPAEEKFGVRVEAPDHRLADEAHGWGRSPFHYTPGYYAAIWRQLADLGVAERIAA